MKSRQNYLIMGFMGVNWLLYKGKGLGKGYNTTFKKSFIISEDKGNFRGVFRV